MCMVCILNYCHPFGESTNDNMKSLTNIFFWIERINEKKLEEKTKKKIKVKQRTNSHGCDLCFPFRCCSIITNANIKQPKYQNEQKKHKLWIEQLYFRPFHVVCSWLFSILYFFSPMLFLSIWIFRLINNWLVTSFHI